MGFACKVGFGLKVFISVGFRCSRGWKRGGKKMGEEKLARTTLAGGGQFSLSFFLIITTSQDPPQKNKNNVCKKSFVACN